MPIRLIGLAVLLAVSLTLGPLAAEAQPAGKVYQIGYLSPRSGIESREEAFRQALGQLGYVEGQNLVIESRDRRQIFPETVASEGRRRWLQNDRLGQRLSRLAQLPRSTAREGRFSGVGAT